jgi:hypothetical protein
LSNSTSWANGSSHSISVPIGIWNLGYKLSTWIYGGAGPTNRADLNGFTTFSTANNSESDVEFTYSLSWISSTGGVTAHSIYTPIYMSKTVVLTSKTTYYLNGKINAGGLIYARGDVSRTLLFATCAYL